MNNNFEDYSEMIKITDKFHNQIDTLIQLHNDYRDALPDSIEKSLSASEFAIEFGTVKCDIGRRIGKSEYVKRRANTKTLMGYARKWLKPRKSRANTKTLVVVPNQDMAKKYFRLGIDVLTVQQVANGATINRKAYETIFIEEPTFVFQIVPAVEVYQHLAKPGVRQVFVQLGV